MVNTLHNQARTAPGAGGSKLRSGFFSRGELGDVDQPPLDVLGNGGKGEKMCVRACARAYARTRASMRASLLLRARRSFFIY